MPVKIRRRIVGVLNLIYQIYTQRRGNFKSNYRRVGQIRNNNCLLSGRTLSSIFRPLNIQLKIGFNNFSLFSYEVGWSCFEEFPRVTLKHFSTSGRVDMRIVIQMEIVVRCNAQALITDDGECFYL